MSCFIYMFKHCLSYLSSVIYMAFPSPGSTVVKTTNNRHHPCLQRQRSLLRMEGAKVEIWKLKSCKNTAQEGCWSLKLAPVLRVPMALRETHVYFTTLFRSLIIRAFQYSLQVPFKGACWALWKNTQVEVRKESGSCLPLSEPSDLGEVTQTLSALFSSLARRGCSYITGFLWRISMAKQRTHQADGWAHGTYSTEMRSPPSLPSLCSRLKGPCAFWGLREDLGHPAVLRAPEETQL